MQKALVSLSEAHQAETLATTAWAEARVTASRMATGQPGATVRAEAQRQRRLATARDAVSAAQASREAAAVAVEAAEERVRARRQALVAIEALEKKEQARWKRAARRADALSAEERAARKANH